MNCRGKRLSVSKTWAAGGTAKWVQAGLRSSPVRYRGSDPPRSSQFRRIGHLERERRSYPLLADKLRRWSDKPEADRAELLRRMVFNAAVTNNDDHPRNHALLRRQKGWRLWPAYDLVPIPVISQERRGLALTVGQNWPHGQCLQPAVADGCLGLSEEEARAEISRMIEVLRNWREIFFTCGVSAKDVDVIAPALLPDCLFFEKRPEG